MEYSRRMFAAVFDKRVDIQDPAALAETVGDLLVASDFEAMLRTDAYIDKLNAGNDHAYDEMGVWFLPAFRMDGLRLDAVAEVGVSREQIRAFLAGGMI
jgi:predicted DsbA family dithiol-disulfide isomerase